ncbi:MAG: hypothetical protein IBX68_08735 [Dehalococcoidia bacterium]|nr:hypothetical protein [Dehalococcoidia bacterium]
MPGISCYVMLKFSFGTEPAMRCVVGKVALIVAIALVVVIGSGLARDEDEWQRIAGAHAFNLVQWEYENLLDKWRYKAMCALNGDCISSIEYRDLVSRYLELEQRIFGLEAEIDRGGTSGSGNTALEAELASLKSETGRLRPVVEEVIESQISSVLAGLGLSFRIRLGGDFDLVFPPVDIAFSQRPNVLIISLRERIELVNTVLLKPDVLPEDRISMEEQVDGLGFSGLATTIGGVATYPSIVPRAVSLETLLSTAAHEWVHQYLAFHPLGRNYWTSYEMRVINETVADIAGDELGRLVYSLFYDGEDLAGAGELPGNGFDFRKAMREIRLAVDDYLASGEIELAELFMEEQRLYLAENGYYIRKLNQAFFAFHGAYGESPASVSPVGEQLRKLREQSSDFREFVTSVSGISSYDDLLKIVGE